MRPGVRRALRLAGRHRRAYAAGFALLAVTSALNLAVPWLLKLVFDGLQQDRDVAFVATLAGVLAAVAVVRAVVRTGSRLAILGASRVVVADLREEVFDHLQRLPVSWYDRTPTGDVVSRIISDLRHVRSLHGPVAMNVANTLALYVAALVVLLGIDPGLTLLAVLPYLLFAGIVRRLSRRLHAESTRGQEALADISSRLSEVLNGITVVKAYRREEDEIALFDGLCERYFQAQRRFARTRASLVPLMGIVSGVGLLVVLSFGGRLVMAGRLSLGDFVAFTTALAMLSWPSIALGWVLNALQRGLASLDRIESLLSEEPELGAAAPSEAVAGARAIAWSGGTVLELRHCTYVHEGAPAGARPALDDVSLRVEAGERLGVVGRPGSGKTTLVELLTGLLKPEPGQVFVGGRDVTEVPARELRSAASVVPQGAFVFSTTVRANVAYGAPESVADDLVEAAVREAALEKDLPHLPEGLQTLVGERGVTLSGGQRQRVTLARALATERELLVLDDALSAVDSETEEEILRGLEARRRRRPRTEVIVSHRLSAVVSCDVIVVMDAGRVVERGTHEELLAADGLYARTWREQELERELADMEA